MQRLLRDPLSISGCEEALHQQFVDLYGEYWANMAMLEDLGIWLREQHGRLSPNSQVAKAIAYSLNAWDALVRFLDDGRLCLTNNAAERALRCIAVGRNNWTFAGSDAGGRRAAAIFTLIETAKLSDVDPQAWLTDVLARLQDHPARRIAELLPWNWKLLQQPQQRAAA